MTADLALHLHASDGELMRRLLARAGLEHRSDDIADIIAQRLALYHEVRHAYQQALALVSAYGVGEGGSGHVPLQN
jgi:adenylate kinase